jgi:hypothetical protein
MMPRLLHRAWRVYADPPESPAARNLKVLIPLSIAGFATRLATPNDWPTLSGTTLVEIGLWYALLWFVRQRDEARAQLETQRQEADV